MNYIVPLTVAEPAIPIVGGTLAAVIKKLSEADSKLRAALYAAKQFNSTRYARLLPIYEEFKLNATELSRKALTDIEQWSHDLNVAADASIAVND